MGSPLTPRLRGWHTFEPLVIKRYMKRISGNFSHEPKNNLKLKIR